MDHRTVFLAILNNFIHSDQELPSMDKMQSEDIMKLLQLSTEHAVFPIIYEGIKTAGADAFTRLPEEIQQQSRTSAVKLIMGQMQQTASFLKLYEELSQLHLPMLVVKGLICRNLYRKPDYRASCDEDILIRREDFHQIDQALLDKKFVREFCTDPMQEQEITYTNGQSGMRLELHMSLFAEDSKAYGHLNQEFTDVFDQYIVEKIEGVSVCTLNYTDHMLYLLCHGLKHFLHSGFGIRQLCDMILFAEAYGDRIDWNDIIERTKKENMYVFWMNLFDIGEKKLGFSWKKAGLDKPVSMNMDSQALLEDILDSGIYGKKDENRLHSANITLQAVAENRNKPSIRTSLFPDFSYMVQQYSYLQSRKWLLPWAWLQRTVSYLKRRKGTGAMEAIRVGRTRTEMLRQYGLIQDKK